MKKFRDLLKEQEKEVSSLKEMIYQINDEKITPNKKILGSLLTGSVARGDARKGPFGIMIDVSVVVKNKDDISLDEVFGPDQDPYIPFHCVPVKDDIWIAVKIIEEKDLWKIRSESESTIFAMNESIILNDKKGILKKWKDEYFSITEEQAKDRAKNQYYRYCYVTGDYRFEKWSYREAWVQCAQNFNEANECYCSFLYCINSMFIPRKDWLTYLTYEMKIKPAKHEEYMTIMYETSLDKESLARKFKMYEEVRAWMEEYIK